MGPRLVARTPAGWHRHHWPRRHSGLVSVAVVVSGRATRLWRQPVSRHAVRVRGGSGGIRTAQPCHGDDLEPPVAGGAWRPRRTRAGSGAEHTGQRARARADRGAVADHCRCQVGAGQCGDGLPTTDARRAQPQLVLAGDARVASAGAACREPHAQAAGRGIGVVSSRRRDRLGRGGRTQPHTQPAREQQVSDGRHISGGPAHPAPPGSHPAAVASATATRTVSRSRLRRDRRRRHAAHGPPHRRR